MLSTQYRLRLEGICKDIASGTEVSMNDMIWAQKLAKANTSARGMLSTARKWQQILMDLALSIWILEIQEKIKKDLMVQMT